jgi:PKD repeat protein
LIGERCTKERLLLVWLSVLVILLVGIPIVSAVAPTASFTEDSNEGHPPLTIHFTDTSTGSPIGWSWFFGDETYNQSWTEQTANAGWDARQKQTSVVLADGSIVLMGGQSDTGNKNDTWISTNKGATWTLQNASSGWSPRFGSSSTVLPNGNIVLMGGRDDSNYFNDTWRSTDRGVTWELMNASSGWDAREGHGSAQDSFSLTDFAIMGGYNGTDYKNDVWLSGDNGTTWTEQTANAEWDARAYFTTLDPYYSSEIVIIGGYNGTDYKDDIWDSSNFDGWGTIWGGPTNLGFPARGYLTSARMPDGTILIMGGNNATDIFNDVWRSTDSNPSFIQAGTAGWSARNGQTSATLPDGSIVIMGGSVDGDLKNDVWRFQPAGSTAQNPVYTYTHQGQFYPYLQAYNSEGSDLYNGLILVSGPKGLGFNRQDILMDTGFSVTLIFQDAINLTIINVVTVRDNYGSNTTTTNGTYAKMYSVGDVAFAVQSNGYISRTVELSVYKDSTNVVLLQPQMQVSNVRQTTYFPHLVRISCMNYLGTPIPDMAVSAVVVESTSPYSWLTDVFGINSNETQILNTTLAGTTDSDGSIAFMMVENLKYRVQFSKPSASISQTNYIYPKEGDYSYVFWAETPPSVSGSININFWNRTNLSNAAYMDLGVRYLDTGSTTDWSQFTVYYENNTVLYQNNASTPNSWNLSYPVLISRGNSYIWGARANNTRYPNQIVQSQIILFGGSPGIPYSLCPETDPDPFHPCMWNKWVALGIIFLVALLFGRATIKYASAIVVLLALFFSYIGWLDYTPLVLSTILFLGIMFYYRYAESESDV